MPLDTSDYYPTTPGSSCDPDYKGEPSAPEGRKPEERKPEDRKPAETEPETERPEKKPDERSKDRDPGSVLKGVCDTLSVVFAPLLTPTYAMLAIFFLTPLRYAAPASIATVTAVVFGITGFLPGLAVWLLMRYGDVSDLALSRRTDRLYPYILMIAAYLGTSFYLRSVGAPEYVPRFFIGACAAAIVNLIINFRWKISAHGAGMGGLVAMFGILTRYSLPDMHLWVWTTAAVLITGLLCSARVMLGRHTPMQTIAGALVGFAAVFISELI